MAGDTEKVIKPRRELRNGTKKYNVLDIATKAWEGVKLLRELVNAEKKFLINHQLVI